MATPVGQLFLLQSRACIHPKANIIARALAQDADLYLMDEPFAAVDAATERAIVRILQEMKSSGKTVVVIHHDLQTVAEACLLL